MSHQKLLMKLIFMEKMFLLQFFRCVFASLCLSTGSPHSSSVGRSHVLRIMDVYFFCHGCILHVVKYRLLITALLYPCRLRPVLIFTITRPDTPPIVDAEDEVQELFKCQNQIPRCVLFFLVKYIAMFWPFLSISRFSMIFNKAKEM